MFALGGREVLHPAYEPCANIRTTRERVAAPEAQSDLGLYLGDFEEFGDVVHAVEELLVQIQRILAVLLRHVKVLL